MNPRSSTRKKKRPRYLSLRRHLAAASPPSISALDDPDQSQPFDLHEEDLSPFFPEEESASLQSLLGSSSSSTRYEDPISPSSSSANYSAASSSLGGGVAAAALRGRAAAVEDRGPSAASRSLSLKLDYDGILTAWQDQWPLYVHEEAHQVVPETHQTAAPLYFSPVFIEVSQSDGGSTGQWTVPDGVGGGGGEKATDMREDRVARVMRYKEKRLRRLYNKRIRYEVRKLNAEKRPRLKGRFIRRDDD